MPPRNLCPTSRTYRSHDVAGVPGPNMIREADLYAGVRIMVPAAVDRARQQVERRRCSIGGPDPTVPLGSRQPCENRDVGALLYSLSRYRTGWSPPRSTNSSLSTCARRL
jgi:hypothetical protein